MLNFDDWLSSKTCEDIEWLIKEYGTLQKAYDTYIYESYNDSAFKE